MGIKLKNRNYLFIVKDLIRNIYDRYGIKLLWLVFLAVLVALTEGLSMVLLLPLLIVMGINSSSETSKISEIIKEIITFLNFNDSLFFLIGILLCVLIFQLAIVVILNWKLAWFQRDYETYWGKKIFTSYSYSNWGMINQQKLGDFTNLMVNETSRVAGAFMCLMQLVTAIITTFVYLIVAFYISFEITICVLSVAIILFVGVQGISRRNYDIGNELGPLTSHFTTKITEFFSNFKLIKVTVTEKIAILEITKIINKLKIKHILATFYPSLVKCFFEFGAFVSLCFILIFSHEYLDQSPASILVVLALFVRLLPKFNALQQNIQVLGNYIPAYEFIKNKTDLADNNSEIELSSKKSKFKIPKQIGKLKVNIKKAGYGKINLLHNINIEIPEIGLIGIVGHSGAGKSTLVNSLLGLTTIYEGNITIGNISIKNVPLSLWRKLIGYVPQETMLFNASIIENIAWAKANAKKDEIIKCAKQALAHDFIMKKPLGYDTNIGDKGAVLSGGQKQRIAIARALLTNPKILIMDESTSSLDHSSELKINETIEVLKKKTCVILVSHKIQNLRNADKIILMKDGKVLEQDSWEKLINQKGHFYDFIKNQDII